MFRYAVRCFRPGMRLFPYRGFSSAPQVHEFKAETKKLLEIVAKSLYMDKEVFVRELVSNSSDALEKLRFQEVSGSEDSLGLLRIQIFTDENEGTITIKDNGTGMSLQELTENLGTIAYSGSAQFILKQPTESIIGQFGVGFYSCFIVADEVSVKSKTSECESAHIWKSSGLGEFTTEVLDEEFERGTEIVIKLKEDSKEYATDKRIQDVVKKYSHFLSFPIEVNGSQINLQDAIWNRPKTELTEEEYKDFYEYISGSKLKYKYMLHFSLDMPLQIKALLYIPAIHSEKFGLSNEELSVDLYSKKVLIKPKCQELFPRWLRFLKGVVDCADIPLNISRETHQDSALMAKINQIITKKVIKFLADESKKDPDLYNQWYEDFGNFLVEAMAMDPSNSREISPLARFHWSLSDKMVSLDTYLEHMKPDQKKIYYLFAANRNYALGSPYMESFIPNDIPVIFSLHHIDEMIFRNIGEYKNYRFVNIESSIESLEKNQMNTSEYDAAKGIPEDDLSVFSEWVRNELEPQVSKVIPSHRLKESPAVIIGDMPSALRQMYKLMDREKHSESFIKGQTLEINVNHELMVNLNDLRKDNPTLASKILAQVLDNALITAGVFENVIPMTKRLTDLLVHASKR